MAPHPTLVDGNAPWLQVLVSDDDGLLHSVHQSIEGLAHETEGGDNVQNVV